MYTNAQDSADTEEAKHSLSAAPMRPPNFAIPATKPFVVVLGSMERMKTRPWESLGLGDGPICMRVLGVQARLIDEPRRLKQC